MQLKYLITALELINADEENGIPGAYPPIYRELREAVKADIQSASPEMVGEFEDLLISKIRVVGQHGYQDAQLVQLLVDLMRISEDI